MFYTAFKYCAVLFLVFVLLTGCGKKEFEATIENFAGYQNWEVIDYSIAPNMLLGEAHMGVNPDYSRRVYINPTGKFEDGEYIQGTILIKETFTWVEGKKQFAEMGGVLAMVKRGGTFNPDANGWEWFVLTPDLSKIMAQGGVEVMEGMCNQCHGMAKGKEGMDMVFTHPKEFEAKEKDFANYSKWTLTGKESKSHPKLMEAHKGGTRYVYKKQPLANPDTDWGYPIGTIIVKEVMKDGKVISVTAMVKRGGEFNKEHNGWEWFMFDSKGKTIKDRGADLMENMCNGCHTAAKDPEFGKDYVFKHPLDPYNK